MIFHHEMKVVWTAEIKLKWGYNCPSFNSNLSDNCNILINLKKISGFNGIWAHALVEFQNLFQVNLQFFLALIVITTAKIISSFWSFLPSCLLLFMSVLPSHGYHMFCSLNFSCVNQARMLLWCLYIIIIIFIFNVISVYVVDNFLSQLIFIVLGMVMYANEFDTKEKLKINWNKKLTATFTWNGLFIFTDSSVDAPPSFKPSKKYADLSGLPVRVLPFNLPSKP